MLVSLVISQRKDVQAWICACREALILLSI
jgi:hypothetical protein